ncbi:MAG: hypothetical protein ACXVCP_06550 [Bdellovibrio sp.]
MKLKVIAMLLILSNMAHAGQALVTKEGAKSGASGVVEAVESKEGKEKLKQSQSHAETVQVKASNAEDRATKELNEPANETQKYGQNAHHTLERALEGCNSGLCTAMLDGVSEVLDKGNADANNTAYNVIQELRKDPSGDKTKAVERGLRASNKDPERVKRDCGG